MKYVITGSLGHISKPLVQTLVAAGHEVDVITSNTERSEQIKELGATPRVGSVSDEAFLKDIFASADAVYTMVPPFFGAPDWKKYIGSIGRNYAAALKGSRVKYVVNLSSIGAHLPQGCGPVSGLHFVEKALNELDNIHVLHLRPGYFYLNFLSNADMIRNMGIIGGNYGSGTKMILADTSDIADVAAAELLKLRFSGKSDLYISSDEKTTDEIASTIGEAIGHRDLKWVDFTDEQTIQGLKQAGLPEEVALNYTEMGGAVRSGEMFADYYARGHKPQGKISLQAFSKEFARFYHQKEKIVS